MTNVTSLHADRDRCGDPVHPLNLLVLKHWEECRGTRPAPAVRDLELRVMAPALGWFGLLERRLDEQRYDWRLAGSGLCEMWGRELRGTEAMTELPGFERDTVLRLFDRVIVTKLPAVMRLSLQTGFGNRRCSAEAMALPFTDERTGRPLVAFMLVPRCPPGIPCQPVVRDAELHFMRLIPAERIRELASSPAPASGATVRRKGKFTVIEGGRPQET